MVDEKRAAFLGRPSGILVPYGLKAAPSLPFQVEAIGVHDLRPGDDEVLHELVLRAVESISLGDRAQLGV